jgi:hypothetical protein
MRRIAVSATATALGIFGLAGPAAAAAPATGGSDGHGLSAPMWTGNFSTGSFSQYQFVQDCPGGVSVVPNPVAGGGMAAKFTVSDANTKYNCSNVYSANPAASILTSGMFQNGDDRYIGFSTLFPTGFPTITSWFQFAELYGPPYSGSPPIGFDVSGNSLGLWRGLNHNYDNPWRAPIQPNVWERIVAHVKFSTDPSVGFIEITLNGVQQKFSNGSTRLYYQTLVPGTNWDGKTPNHLDLDQYRGSSPALGTVSIYHSNAEVGMTYASVQ